MVFSRQHHVMSVLSMVIVSAWVFAVEGLCLYAEYDSQRTVILLLGSAAINIGVVLPVSAYLTRSETRENARWAGVLSILTAIALSGIAVVLFANSEGDTAVHGAIVMVLACFQLALALYTLYFSRSLPAAHARPSRIRVVAASDEDESLLEQDAGDLEEAMLPRLKSGSKKKGSREKASKTSNSSKKNKKKPTSSLASSSTGEPAEEADGEQEGDVKSLKSKGSLRSSNSSSKKKRRQRAGSRTKGKDGNGDVDDDGDDDLL